MKAGIHPDYQETVIKCNCGAEYKTRSTVQGLTVEICAACHPFYTKQNKQMNTAGRVEKFKQKYNLK